MTIYQEELKRRLREQGHGALYDEETGMLKIYQNGVFLCDQDKNGNLHFTRDAYALQNFYEISTPIAKEAVSVKDCVALYEKGEPMKVGAVSNYHKFLEFGETILAGAYDKEYGFKFATWNKNQDGTYLVYGHYMNSYEKAKENFAVRAGLINKNKVFTQEQAELIFKSVNYARDNCEHVIYDQDKEMDGIMENLIHGYPEKDFSVMSTHFEPSQDITPKQ
ncbi:MAG: hypothetical protein IJX91_02380 [Clostridia bacterium]|nr:hypothetical protein [Clostridia bacterium]